MKFEETIKKICALCQAHLYEQQSWSLKKKAD